MSSVPLSKALDVPERVTLELTNHCNLNCSFCPRQHMDYPLGFMDKNLFRSLVNDMAALGTRTLVPFFRGEPLLHPDCLELLAHAKSHALTIQLATNGLLLTEEMGCALVAMEVDFVSFSVDASNPKTYKERRKGGSFSRMLHGVDHLCKARIMAGKNLPRIQVSAVDLGMSTQEKEAFITFWKKKADQIRIYPQHSKNGRFGSLEASENMARQTCFKPFREMVIYWDGRAVICNHDWNRHVGLGDATTTELLEIWNNTNYHNIRCQQQRLQFPANSVCRTCSHWRQYSTDPTIIGELIT